MTKQNDIKELIKRFFEGVTTAVEEKMLYDYFAADDVAKELRSYQKMFRWYAGGMKESLPRRSKRRTLFVRLAVAASVIALFGVGFGCYKHFEDEKMYTIYKDSYIVRNGKKITNLKQIQPELERVSMEAALTFMEGYVDEPVGEKNIPVI